MKRLLWWMHIPSVHWQAGLLLTLIAVFGLVTTIRAAPNAEELTKWVLGSSGGAASAETVELSDVFGQAITGMAGAGDVSIESGFWNSTDFPTAVTAVDFTVNAASRSSALITWVTLYEAHLVGFHLYRGPSSQGPFTCITSEPILPQGMGGMTGNTYAYVDTGLQPAETYVYFLEALHTDRPPTRYEAVSVLMPTEAIYLPLVKR